MSAPAAGIEVVDSSARLTSAHEDNEPVPPMLETGPLPLTLNGEGSLCSEPTGVTDPDRVPSSRLNFLASWLDTEVLTSFSAGAGRTSGVADGVRLD